MISFELSLPILKREYANINREILRFDFQYNGYHIYFLYKPTLIEGGKDLFVFNADVKGNFICQPLVFTDNKISTRINDEIYLIFYNINRTPNKFFSEVNQKIIDSEVNYTYSTAKEMTEKFDNFHIKFPNLKFDKPFFWRFTSLPKGKDMSSGMEKKLSDNGLTNFQIKFLQTIRRTAQFTLKSKWERNIHINLENLRK